jgi:hypothetical protein
MTMHLPVWSAAGSHFLGKPLSGRPPRQFFQRICGFENVRGRNVPHAGVML